MKSLSIASWPTVHRSGQYVTYKVFNNYSYNNDDVNQNDFNSPVTRVFVVHSRRLLLPIPLTFPSFSSIPPPPSTCLTDINMQVCVQCFHICLLFVRFENVCNHLTVWWSFRPLLQVLQGKMATQKQCHRRRDSGMATIEPNQY